MKKMKKSLKDLDQWLLDLVWLLDQDPECLLDLVQVWLLVQDLL